MEEVRQALGIIAQALLGPAVSWQLVSASTGPADPRAEHGLPYLSHYTSGALQLREDVSFESDVGGWPAYNIDVRVSGPCTLRVLRSGPRIAVGEPIFYITCDDPEPWHQARAALRARYEWAEELPESTLTDAVYVFHKAGYVEDARVVLAELDHLQAPGEGIAGRRAWQSLLDWRRKLRG